MSQPGIKCYNLFSPSESTQYSAVYNTTTSTATTTLIIITTLFIFFKPSNKLLHSLDKITH